MTRKPVPEEPRTLAEVYELLRRQSPPQDAPLQKWHDFLRASARLYTEIADIDRRHHHEALACASTEQRAADEVAARIAEAQQPEKE